MYSNKKIIMHVVESTATGTLSMLSMLANNQAEIGHNVVVVYSRREETPLDLSQYFHPAVSIINIQMTGFKAKLLSFLRLRKVIKSNKPHCLFLHSSFAGFIGRFAALGIKLSCFYIPHCISFMRKDISTYKKSVFVLLERIASVKSSLYIACSDSEKRNINKYLPRVDVVTVENAVDVHKWITTSQWTDRALNVVTVGQIRYQKDPMRFASIAKAVLSQTSDLKFIWIGDGEEELKANLIEAGVIVTGWKKSDEVKELLSKSKYYLSTSLWEGMPVSPIEAMISGCLVVLSDCDGNVDVVHHGETGMVFHDAESGVRLLLNAINDQATSQRLANKGSEQSKNKYSAKRYLEQMESLIGGRA